MNHITLDFCELSFHENYIQIELFDAIHLDLIMFEELLNFKQEVYEDKEVGVLLYRINDHYSNSFDPLIFINRRQKIETNCKWLVVISSKKSDMLDVQLIRQLTDLPCEHFPTYKKAEKWILKKGYLQNSNSLSIEN